MSEDIDPQEALGMSDREYVALALLLIIGAPILVIGAPVIAAALLFPLMLWVVVRFLGAS